LKSKVYNYTFIIIYELFYVSNIVESGGKHYKTNQNNSITLSGPVKD